MALIDGGDTPGLSPFRVAKINRHVQDIASGSPIRAARGQAKLTAMKLSPAEHTYTTLKVQNQSPPVSAPNPQVQSLPVTPPVQSQRIVNMETRAVNQYSQRLLKQMAAGANVKGMKFAAPGASPVDNRIVGLAREYLGTPYVWGGESAKGFDCSGFAQFIYAKVGVKIPRTTYTQWTARNGRAVPAKNLQPGDLVFFKGSDSKGGLPGHVGVYIGGDMMIDAPHTGADVRVERVSTFGGFMGARRFH